MTTETFKNIFHETRGKRLNKQIDINFHAHLSYGILASNDLDSYEIQYFH